MHLVADAAPPSARGAAHRGAGVPAAVVARLFMSELGAAHRAGPTRRPGRPDGRGLRRADAHRRRRPRHHHRRRPRVAAQQDRHPAAAHMAREPASRGAQQPHAGGAGEQRRRAGAVPAVRLPPCRRPQELLRRDQRGCPGDVGRRHRQPTSTRRRVAHIEERSRATTIVESVADGQRRARPRHRDVVRRDGRRGRRRRQPTCCRRSCPARSTSTPASAASCPRSPAAPTSSC